MVQKFVLFQKIIGFSVRFCTFWVKKAQVKREGHIFGFDYLLTLYYKLMVDTL